MAGHNGNGRVAPAAYPPPVDPQKEFIKRELDPEDERIDVGVAIVGGGTAGLATANRLLQLLADDPETMERLGEVDRRIAVARGTDELRAFGSGEQELKPLGGERLVVGNQDTQRIVLKH